MLGLIFYWVGTPLVGFFIIQYDFGLGCEGDFCSFFREEGVRGCSIPTHQGEPIIQYVSKSLYICIYVCMYMYIYILYIYIYKHTEWVRQPSKKCLVCIT